MIPLIIIIALVVAGIVLLCIDRQKRLNEAKAIELFNQALDECASLTHPADPVTFHHHKKPVKKATKKRVTIRKKQVKNGKVPKVRKPR